MNETLIKFHFYDFEKVPWVEESENVFAFKHSIEHKVRTDLTMAFKKGDIITVLALYKMT